VRVGAGRGRGGKGAGVNSEDQQLVCLEIMSRGEDMLAVGVWEPAIKRLAMRGLCRKIGNGYRIADAGVAFLAGAEGKTVAEVEASMPAMPEWIAAPVPGAGLAVLRRNEISVSGYDVATLRYRPVTHGEVQEADKLMVLEKDVDSFLQTMLDAAWRRGLRPSDG